MALNDGLRFHIGVDIGGTFTDVVAVDSTGATTRAKVPTTPDDYTRGIVAGIDRLSEVLKLPRADLMSATELFINGTTIVTNAIAELKGRRTGVIITRGFGNTLRIARSARTNEMDLHTQTPPPDVVAPTDIVEVDERVDFAGREVVTLDEAQVAAAARLLIEEHGCQAIAICFLWSFINPTHERRAKEIVERAHPAVFVSASCDVFPVAREYERLVTTVFNAFASEGVARYVDALEARLREVGCPAAPSIMQSIGGLMSPAEARQVPISLINSGPAGGVIGARALARELGLRDVITADMGGTSFDTALIKDQRLTLAHRAQIGKFATGLSMIDISAIGAGGGSIFWIDNRGAPRVGPESAGADPGPAAYGRGGARPTVTDMAVTMNLIDPDYFLGGSIRLDPDEAEHAIRTHICEPLGWGLDEALTGLCHILVDTMSNAVRAISIEKGYDPRDFTMLGFGGASGLFLPLICRATGIHSLVIPNNAAAFSAYGLLWADGVRSFVQTVNWIVPAGPLEPVNNVLASLAGQARRALVERGFHEDAIELTYEGDFKFAGQAFEVSVPLHSGSLTEADRSALTDTFTRSYERLYGPGTAWEGFPVLMLNARVTATGRVTRPALVAASHDGHDAGGWHGATHRTAVVVETGRREPVPVYRGGSLRPGTAIEGPALIDDVDTTVYVPGDGRLEVDELRNYRMAL
jgi:N-methylhydantoinase A